MLENCNADRYDHALTMSAAEFRSQFATFAIQTSPLILGNDVRNMSKECLQIISNKEIIALNQDPLVSRAKLVYQVCEEHIRILPATCAISLRNSLLLTCKARQFPLNQWPNNDKLPPHEPPVHKDLCC